MVKVADYINGPVFGWSFDETPYLATALGDSTNEVFNPDSSVLEQPPTLKIWSIISSDSTTPVASLETDATFRSLAWSVDSELIAGAMDNNTVELFKTDKKDFLESIGSFKNGAEDITKLQFNYKQPNILLSGSSTGKLQVWDTNHVNNVNYHPVIPGAKTQSSTTASVLVTAGISSIAWNHSLSHVFASAASTSFASIWDLKANKEVLKLAYTSPDRHSPVQMTVVEWDPSNSTKVATAGFSQSDNISSIYLWDLRKSSTPSEILTNNNSEGHKYPVTSLSWCNPDPRFLISSAEGDFSVNLWNTESAEALGGYSVNVAQIDSENVSKPLNIKMAPNFPELVAYANLDSKVTVRTLQDYSTSIDMDKSQSLENESEDAFWNDVSIVHAKMPIKKPTIYKIVAPNWYTKKTEFARWGFGNKIVSLSSNGKGIKISKPNIDGLFQENNLLSMAIDSKDFNAIVNKRIAKPTDAINEEDWNLIEKLSLDGKDEVFSESIMYEDDSFYEESKKSDSDEFFTNSETQYQPQGAYLLSDKLEEKIAKFVSLKNYNAAIRVSLENNLLMEAMLLAMDSNDGSLVAQVKKKYYSTYGNRKHLTRFVYSSNQDSIEDLVENLDISQWKIIVNAIVENISNKALRNQYLERVGDRLVSAGNRQDAIVLYSSINISSKVFTLWLVDFKDTQRNILKKSENAYFTHIECLNEFVEKVYAFSNSLGMEAIEIDDTEIISKILEYTDIAYSNGAFELVKKVLAMLPQTNEEVKNKQVLISSMFEGIPENNLPTLLEVEINSISETMNLPAYVNSPISKNGSTPASESHSKVDSYVAENTSSYIPFPGVPTNVSTHYQNNSLNSSNVVSPQINSPLTSYLNNQVNPYAPPIANNRNSSASLSQMGNVKLDSSLKLSSGHDYQTPETSFSSTPVLPLQSLVKPTATILSNSSTTLASTNSNGNETSNTSGQNINRKAQQTTGWNDLPMNITEKVARAKPVQVMSMQPVQSVGSFPLQRVASSQGYVKSRTNSIVSMSSINPPPRNLSRKPSVINPQKQVMSNQNPYGTASHSRKLSNLSGIPVVGNTAYAPSKMTPSTPSASNFLAPQPSQIGSNGFADNATNTPINSNKNPYAPVQSNGLPPTSQTANNNYKYNSAVPHVPSQTMPPSQAQTAGPPPSMFKRQAPPPDSGLVASNFTTPLSIQSHPEDPSNDLTDKSFPEASSPAQQTIPNISNNLTASQINVVEEQEIVQFFNNELKRVIPLIPQEYSKQLKDCKKRLQILFQHMEKKDLISQLVISKVYNIVELMKQHKFDEAMEIHQDILTNHPQEAGNWLTGVKRMVAISKATS